MSKEKQYWAFVSYSSRDKKWGQWLHRRLENYPIPKDFQGLELFDGAVLGKNLRPVFRDRDELSGSADLGSSIREALEASRYLVVLCSKNSAKSKWVNKEIEDFQALEKGDRILALILDGEPNAENPDDECFPPALRYPAEPIAGDLRKEGDGKARGFLKILAGISQVGFDDLYRRHERAQAKRRVVLGTVALLLVSVFAGLAALAWKQKQIAEDQRDRATVARSAADRVINTMLYDLRDDLIERGGSALYLRISTVALDYFETFPPEELQGSVARKNATALLNRADALICAGKPDEARELTERSVRILKTLLEEQPDEESAKRDLAIAYDHFGEILFELDGPLAAKPFYQMSLELMSAVYAQAPDSQSMSDLAQAHFRMGRAAHALEGAAAARVWHRKSQELFQSLEDADPSEENTRALAISVSRLADLEKELDGPSAARPLYERSCSLLKSLCEMSPSAMNQRALATAYEKLGDLAVLLGDSQAKQLYSKCADLFLSVYEADESAQNARSLSFSYWHLSCVEEGEAQAGLARQALSLMKVLYERGVLSSQDQDDLELFAQRAGDYAFLQKLAEKKSHADIAEWERGSALSQACWYAQLAGDVSAAILYGEQAVMLLGSAAAMHPATKNLAHAYLFSDRFEKAKEYYAIYFNEAFGGEVELGMDYKLLRSQGHDHPDMKKIESLLTAGKLKQQGGNQKEFPGSER